MLQTRSLAPDPARPLWILPLLYAVLLSTAFAGAGRPAFAQLVLRESDRFPRVQQPSAVAVRPDGSLAVGDARGVWLAAPGDRARRVSRLGEVRGLAFDREGALWIASEDGLHRLPSAEAAEPSAVADPPAAAPVTRERPPARSSAATSPASGPVGVAPAPEPDGPSIQALHEAAIAHLDLHPSRMRALAGRVRRRGFLPVLELRGGYGGGRGARFETDETFTSGADRVFHDVDLDRERDFDVALVLRWDLGDAAYHPEMIDVARETREWIELRDEVLDEITQHYFARAAALAELRRASDPIEAARWRRRAAEAAAGIDAWTGGALRRATRPDSPDRSRTEPTP